MTLTQVTTGGVDENINIDSNTLKVDGTNNRVGIGTASPSVLLHVSSSGDTIARVTSADGNGAFLDLGDASDPDGGRIVYDSGSNLTFSTASSERLRIDSSGRLLIGTSTSPSGGDSHSQNAPLLVQGRIGSDADSGRINLQRGSAASNGSSIGSITFTDNSNNAYARLEVEADATTGSNDYPGRIKFSTTADGASSPTERMRIDSSGNVGINTLNPTNPLTVKENNNICINLLKSTDASILTIGEDGSSGALFNAPNGPLVFQEGGVEAMRIDSSGHLGIGTSSIARGPLHINSSTTDTFLHVTNSSTGSSGSDGFSLHQLGNDIVLNNRELANMRFYTANTERMRITNGGFLGIGTTSPEVLLHPSSTNNNHLSFEDARHPSYTNQIKTWRCGTNASSAWKFLNCESGCFGGTFDVEFILRGDGNAYADGSWNGGGADYAEYFEWSDGNTNAEDRRGISVVLDGDKIREAVDGEEPIGVISGNPSVVGDAAWNRWNKKYVRDDYGSYVLDKNGHRQVTAEYNSETEYISREERPEWDTVGLMGKLRIRKGQVTGTRWIKMRDVSDTVEEWLVR